MTDADRDDLIDAYFEAMDAGNLDPVREALADDFRYESPAGDFEGTEGLREYVEDHRSLADSTHEIDVRVHDASASVAEGTVRGTTEDGGSTEAGFCDVFEFDEADGHITRLAVYLNDA